MDLNILFSIILIFSLNKFKFSNDIGLLSLSLIITGELVLKTTSLLFVFFHLKH
jgi:hypothetical protein